MNLESNILTTSDSTLSQREQDILLSIVNLYILKGAPVGSRPLAKYLEDRLSLSPATLRNVMSDLEERNLITHPHTSAGRIPTDKGYRYYVNSLATVEHLSDAEILSLKENIDSSKPNSEAVLREAGKLLGTLSQYLGIVRIPQIVDLIVHRIELMNIGTGRLLVVLALDSNIVRTVTLEVQFDLETKYLSDISAFINEKVAGKPLRFLRENFIEMINDFSGKDKPLVRLFIDSIDKIFSLKGENEQILTAGTQNLFNYPEFEDISKARSIIELIENEDVIIHLLDNIEGQNDSNIKVLIGAEIPNETMDNYSIVVSNYSIGSASGSIGLIGPKRMNYGKMMSLVKNISELLSANK